MFGTSTYEATSVWPAVEMDQPPEPRHCNSENPDGIGLTPCGLLKTEEPSSQAPSGPFQNGPVNAEPPSQRYLNPVGTVETPRTLWHHECDEPPHEKQDRSSTPTETERTDTSVHHFNYAMVEAVFSKTSFELRSTDITNSVSSQLQGLNEENSALRRENADLRSDVRNLRIQKQETTESLQAARQQVRKVVEESRAKSRANGNKIPDFEFKSKWKQLKFNVKMLSGHILDNYPEESPPAWLWDRFMQTFRNDKTREAPDSFFQGLGNRRLALEAFLWGFISRVVFDSRSRTGEATGRSIFKRLRKEYGRLEIPGDSSQIAAVYKWLQSGWAITNLATPDSVNGLLLKECGCIYQMINGNDGGERSSNRAESREELRDILSLALELDGMMMTSQAMFTVVWPVEVPQLNAGNYTGYRESYMEAVQEDGEPSDDVMLRFCVTPILLKRGNARGMNYESQIVLVKGDVVVAYGSGQGSTEPLGTKEDTTQ